MGGWLSKREERRPAYRQLNTRQFNAPLAQAAGHSMAVSRGYWDAGGGNAGASAAAPRLPGPPPPSFGLREPPAPPPPPPPAPAATEAHPQLLPPAAPAAAASLLGPPAPAGAPPPPPVHVAYGGPRSYRDAAAATNVEPRAASCSGCEELRRRLSSATERAAAAEGGGELHLQRAQAATAECDRLRRRLEVEAGLWQLQRSEVRSSARQRPLDALDALLSTSRSPAPR